MISTLPSIANAAEGIREGRIEPLELVEFCLQQIGQHDQRVKAWVLVDADGARDAARRLSSAIRGGESPGLLSGMPIAVKDIIDVAGMPTMAGYPRRAGCASGRPAP